MTWPESKWYEVYLTINLYTRCIWSTTMKNTCDPPTVLPFAQSHNFASWCQARAGYRNRPNGTGTVTTVIVVVVVGRYCTKASPSSPKCRMRRRMSMQKPPFSKARSSTTGRERERVVDALRLHIYHTIKQHTTPLRSPTHHNLGEHYCTTAHIHTSFQFSYGTINARTRIQSIVKAAWIP